MAKPVLNFDHSAGKRYCEQLGMGWDFHFAERVDRVASESGITQEQFDIMIREYAWKIKTLFTPRSYPYWQRVMIAFYFLNPFAKKDN